MLGHEQRQDRQAAPAHGQTDADAVGKRHLPEILRQPHAEKPGRHEHDAGQNHRSRAAVVGKLAEQQRARGRLGRRQRVRQRRRRARQAELPFDRRQKQAERAHADGGHRHHHRGKHQERRAG